MLVPRDGVHFAYFNIEGGERGVKLSTKKYFFEITEGRQ